MTEFVIPLDPYTKPPLSMNDRSHWSKAHREKSRLRDIVFYRCRQLKVPHLDRVAVELHWLPKDRRRRDGDNPMPTIKACVDALVQARVLDDDDTSRVVHRGLVLHDVDGDDTKPHGNLWLRLEPLPPLDGDRTLTRVRIGDLTSAHIGMIIRPTTGRVTPQIIQSISHTWGESTATGRHTYLNLAPVETGGEPAIARTVYRRGPFHADEICTVEATQ
jgi:crossover junction endodeoxyribonuclease RusA